MHINGLKFVFGILAFMEFGSQPGFTQIQNAQQTQDTQGGQKPVTQSGISKHAQNPDPTQPHASSSKSGQVSKPQSHSSSPTKPALIPKTKPNTSSNPVDDMFARAQKEMKNGQSCNEQARPIS